MLTTSPIDPGRTIDWGLTSKDYATFRPGPPDTFYDKLRALGVGLAGQRVLDLGTGTGVVARHLARQGCHVTGVDIAPAQIEAARRLAVRDGLDITFEVAAAEAVAFPPQSFDVVTANQCFLYFDKAVVPAIMARLLKPNGLFVTSHFSWLPLLDPVAQASEALILKHNPAWTAHSYDGKVPPFHGNLEQTFRLKGFFWYDEHIPFTRESWRGRIRACRGIGAALSPEQVDAFDEEHRLLLERIAPESFGVLHRIDAHIWCSGD